jgi:hypothetical protein
MAAPTNAKPRIEAHRIFFLIISFPLSTESWSPESCKMRARTSAAAGQSPDQELLLCFESVLTNS